MIYHKYHHSDNNSKYCNSDLVTLNSSSAFKVFMVTNDANALRRNSLLKMAKDEIMVFMWLTINFIHASFQFSEATTNNE